MDWVFFLFMLFLGSMMDNLELKLHIFVLIILFIYYRGKNMTLFLTTSIQPCPSGLILSCVQKDSISLQNTHMHLLQWQWMKTSGCVTMHTEIGKKNLRWMSQRSELDVFLKYNSPGLHVKCLYLLKFDLVKVDHKTYGRVSNFIAI